MINRINIEVFKETIEKAKKDPSTALKTLEFEGVWRLDTESGPQFETKLKTENAGEILVQSDETIMLGGGGTAPNPIQYCIGGLLACFSATFVKSASMEGIVIKAFKVKGIINLDLSASFGLSGNPAFSNVGLELIIESNATLEKLLEICELAKKRCPAYYCLTHEVIPQIDIKKN